MASCMRTGSTGSDKMNTVSRMSGGGSAGLSTMIARPFPAPPTVSITCTVGLVEVIVASYEDPGQRVGIGVRLFLHIAQAHTRFAAFLWRTAFHAAMAQVVLQTYLPEHIEEVIRAGSFNVENTEGRAATRGTCRASFFRVPPERRNDPSEFSQQRLS